MRKRRVPGMHGFDTANEGGADSRLPAPEQWLLTKNSEMEAAEIIEQHIDYVGEGGRSVHLPMDFVRHCMRRHDGELPTVVAVVTLPVVLGDGTMLGQECGLDRGRGTVFHIAPELMALVPRREDCTPEAVGAAMQFLTDEWLCDVQSSYADKCVAVAAALTLIERTMLPDRPAFFITAGRRGGGKTTLNKMLIWAVTGQAMAASAWSPSEEERRKSLHSYLMAAVGYVGWDDVPAGTRNQLPSHREILHVRVLCGSQARSQRDRYSLVGGRSHLHGQQHRTARRPGLAQFAHSTRRRPARSREPRVQAPRPDRLDGEQSGQNPELALHRAAGQPPS